MARVPAGIRRGELVELLEINEEIRGLSMRKKELTDKAKRAHADLEPKTFVYGPVVLSLTDAKKFDVDAFEAAYPVEQHPSYYVAAVGREQVPAELRGRFVIIERRLEVKRSAIAGRIA